MFEAFQVKHASTDKLQDTERVMRAIYEESPSFWPYGLDVAGYDDLYMVTKKGSDEPVGFVGWQVIHKDMQKVGYYSMGILPQYRRNGFAKKAVSILLEKKAKEVDSVRALIMENNQPSINLAKELGAHIEIKSQADFHKAASISAGGKAAGKISKKLLGTSILGGTLLGGPGVDYGFHGDEEGYRVQDMFSGASPERQHRAKMNTALGALAGLITPFSPAAGLSAGLAIPAKDLIFKGVRTLDKADESLDPLSTLLENNKDSKGSTELARKLGPWVAGAGLLTGAGMLAHARMTRADKNKEDRKIKVKLPSDQFGETTEITVPWETEDISDSLRASLARDIRRRLVAGTKERTVRRKPTTTSTRRVRSDAGVSRKKDEDQEEAGHVIELQGEMDDEDLGFIDNLKQHLTKQSSTLPPPPLPPGGGLANPKNQQLFEQAGKQLPGTSTTSPAQPAVQQQQAAQQNPTTPPENPELQKLQMQNQQTQQMMEGQMQQMQMQSQQQLQQIQMENTQLKQQMQLREELAKSKDQLTQEKLKLESIKKTTPQATMSHLQRLRNKLTKRAGFVNAWQDKKDIARGDAMNPLSKRISTGHPFADRLRYMLRDLITKKHTDPPYDVSRLDTAKRISDLTQGMTAPPV